LGITEVERSGRALNMTEMQSGRTRRMAEMQAGMVAMGLMPLVMCAAGLLCGFLLFRS
ncbi:MAG: hypothetical protein JWM69_881, partial [Candidatus Binatus sp.]|nr:hypothetical protein [Candidatus Binatus sp.]